MKILCDGEFEIEPGKFVWNGEILCCRGQIEALNYQYKMKSFHNSLKANKNNLSTVVKCV